MARQSDLASSRSIGVLAAWIAIDAAVGVYLSVNGANAASALLLAAGVGLFALAMIRPAVAVDSRSVAVLLVLAVVGHLAVRALVPYRSGPPDPPPTIQFVAGGALVVLAALALGERLTARPLLIVGLWASLLAGAAVRVVVLAADVAPTFDVPLIQVAAGQAILQGADPYLTRVYQSGYPYLPVAAMAAAVGVVLGDARWPSVLADAATALALVVIGRRFVGSPLIGVTAGALWMWSSGGLFVIWQNFPESVLVALGTLAIVPLTRARPDARLAGVLLGLAAATKQFGLGFLPFLPFGGRGGLVAFGWSVAVGTAIVIPFAVWHPAEFLEGTVLAHVREPGRDFALNLLNWPGSQFELPLGLVLPAPLLAGWWCASRVADPVSAWLAGSAGLFLVAFAFNPIAFVNYYAIVLGLLLALALALSRVHLEEPT